MLSQSAGRYLRHIGRVRHTLLDQQIEAATRLSPLYLHQQKRHLDLQEYQSKKLLDEHKVKVQRFKVVSTHDEAHQALFPEEYSLLESDTNESSRRWSGMNTDLSTASEYVIKAQVLAGGRGKGHFKKSGLTGGVLLTEDRKRALDYASNMLNDYLVTKQTNSQGVLVKKVMIAEAVRLKDEFYFAILLDRSYEKGFLFVTCPNGGMDIEEVAEKDPKLIRHFTIPLEAEFDFETARRTAMMAFDLNVSHQSIVDQCAREMMKLHSMFLKLDATQIEINPLGVTKKSEVICVDAKIKFDENARFRQRWLDEVEKMNKNETDIRDYEARAHNLNFIGLNGSIGCLVNGAGLAMATMDIIKLHGGEPANFLDVGGGATTEQVFEAFRIITSDSSVRAIFVNIFGGIMRCDTVAEAILQAAQRLNLRLPIVCRLQGTRVEDAQELIVRNKGKAGLNLYVVDDLDDAAKLAVKLIDFARPPPSS